MKKRLFYGSGVAALAVLVTLVVWQGSFSFGDYGPQSASQTFIFWAVSTLVFLLTLTLGFILLRTAVKLYIERRSNREGSRIKTKMVIGALTLSFLPVFFLVLWSVYVLNRNLDKWFSRPAVGIVNELGEVRAALEREVRDRARLQAMWLASLPETASYLETGQPPPAGFGATCRDNAITEARLIRQDGEVLVLCAPEGRGGDVARVQAPAGMKARVEVAAPWPVDLAQVRDEITRDLRAYDQLSLDRKSARAFYLQMLLLLTLFILFVATWLALFLARQVSVPISALLEAAGEVRKGNLGHRVQVRAGDELATLVRSFNEMTEALEANRRELDSRRRFTEAILESIPTGVISVSSDGRILRVNEALGNILPREQVAAAEELEDLFSRDDTAEIKYLMKRARRIGLASGQMELKRGRQTLHLSVTASALETKLTSGFVLVLEDTSELLRAQKSAAWHEVARRIAHEIKNPLTPIALSAERILRQLARTRSLEEAAPKLQDAAATIVQEVESLKTLVDEFSQFARFPKAQPVPADLNEVVENGLAVFEGRLDGIEIEKDLAPNLPRVNLDREQFKRVVVNLVDNAAEAMRDSLVKRLYVSTDATGADTVELVVADTGCGVAPEEKEKLFLPYFSTKGRGTGLGLAIASHIVSVHNAQIRVEDNRPCGARFVVEIPIPAAQGAESPVVEARA
ncbi:MAG: HAMP domain-containing protein [Bryobacterales bacterium]|nr:HAMP domain-containing protein [Bryobacterales bacterium]